MQEFPGQLDQGGSAAVCCVSSTSLSRILMPPPSYCYLLAHAISGYQDLFPAYMAHDTALWLVGSSSNMSEKQPCYQHIVDTGFSFEPRIGKPPPKKWNSFLDRKLTPPPTPPPSSKFGGTSIPYWTIMARAKIWWRVTMFEQCLQQRISFDQTPALGKWRQTIRSTS